MITYLQEYRSGHRRGNDQYTVLFQHTGDSDRWHAACAARVMHQGRKCAWFFFLTFSKKGGRNGLCRPFESAPAVVQRGIKKLIKRRKDDGK